MTYSYLHKPISSSKMQRRIRFILEVWILQILRVVAYDAFYEREVVEVDCAAQAARYINPVLIASAFC
jgi:hypothetical protein